MRRWFLLSVALMVLHWPAIASAQSIKVTHGQRETITLPIAIYILDSDDNSGKRSSRRTVKSFESHFKQVNNIWSQAGIAIEPVAYERVKAPKDLLWSIAHRIGNGGLRDFYRGVRRGEVEFKNANTGAVMWAFYVRSMGGVNGLAPSGTRTFFVADNPTVDDARVTSHEIGHVLGLYHVNYSQRMLLYSGANGTRLSEEEQDVARYNAKRLLR